MSKRERNERENQEEANRIRAIGARMREEARPLAIATRDFIGDARKASVRVERATTYGLGGVSILVRGDGTVRIDKHAFGPHEREVTHQLTLPAKDVDAIFEGFIADEFARLVIPEHFGVPDEISYTIELTNAAGLTRRASKFVRCQLPPFERLVAIVGARVVEHLDATLREQLTLG